MNDALYIAGYIALAFFCLIWAVAGVFSWFAERIKHD